MNGVAESVEANNAVVGTNIEVKGHATETTISPSDLLDCDALVMDCEGAELSILRNMEIRPQVIIVECHRVFDAPESEVREALNDSGYDVVDRGDEVSEEVVLF